MLWLNESINSHAHSCHSRLLALKTRALPDRRILGLFDVVCVDKFDSAPSVSRLSKKVRRTDRDQAVRFACDVMRILGACRPGCFQTVGPSRDFIETEAQSTGWQRAEV